MRRLVVLALLVAPQIARADWSVTPPKGWKPATGEEAEKVQKDVDAMQARLHAPITGRTWHEPPPGNGSMMMTYVDKLPADLNTTLRQFADTAANGAAKVPGFKVVASTPAVEDKIGEAVAYRTFSNGKLTGQIVSRVRMDDHGGREALVVTCLGRTAAVCKAVITSARLVTPK